MGFFNKLFQSDNTAPAADARPTGPDAATARAVLAELDIDQAVLAHDGWKARLEAMIKSNSADTHDPELVCRDDHCDLGRWLNGLGQMRLGHYPAFSVLVARHRHFHQEAAAVLTLAQAGEREKAEQRLRSGYRHASNQVVLLLKELKRGLVLR